MKQALTPEILERFVKESKANKHQQVAHRTVSKNGLVESATDFEIVTALKAPYSIDITSGDITNQKRSGRCWMFAGLNVLRPILAKKLNVKSVELSEAYLQFYDKLEKANFMLEEALHLAEEPLNSRLNEWNFTTGIGDGGHFQMFVSLVEKYGLVPHEIMPDNDVNSYTADLNDVLEELLDQDILALREMRLSGKSHDAIEAKKVELLSEIYRVLTTAFGVPPTSFVYEYKDKDDKFIRLKKMTPKAFYEEYLKDELDDYVVLSHAPLSGMKDYQKYATTHVGNLAESKPVTFFNVSLPEFRAAVLSSLKGERLVWFGADVSSSSLRGAGVLSRKAIRLDDLLDVKLTLNKGERLDTYHSYCNHAMVFGGCNVIRGKVDRYKVINSWGKDAGMDGYFAMDADWFDNFVYEVFVKRSFLPEDLLKKFDESEIEWIEPFTPMWSMFK